MAITANTVWECRATATAGNVNGGGFDPTIAGAGTDWSLQNAAQYPLVAIATGGAGATFLTALASADMVGNIAHVISGVNFTPGWYQIISVVAGVSVTCDANLATGVGANGVINIGGAMSLGSILDNDFFQLVPVPGNTIWIKKGNYTLGENIVAHAVGTLVLPIYIIGYKAVRGDEPIGDDRPHIDTQGFTWALGTNSFNKLYNLDIYGAVNGTLLNVGSKSVLYNCKATNNTSVASRNAISIGGGSYLIGVEAICSRGNCVNSASGSIIGCYFHHSRAGIVISNTNTTLMLNCLIENCWVNAISLNFGAGSTYGRIIVNTLIGFTGIYTAIGIAISDASAANSYFDIIANNIIWGFAAGLILNVDVEYFPVMFNDFFNNTIDVTNRVERIHCLALDPQFKNVTEITGATATTAGFILTQLGADFSTVVDNRDYCYIISGAGVTVGMYLIVGHTIDTLTLDIAPGDSAVANKVFQVTTNHDYRIGANLKGQGFPGTIPVYPFPTLGNMDIGALQEAGGLGIINIINE